MQIQVIYFKKNDIVEIYIDFCFGTKFVIIILQMQLQNMNPKFYNIPELGEFGVHCFEYVSNLFTLMLCILIQLYFPTESSCGIN